MSWASPQQEKFLSAFAFAYARTKPYSSQRNTFLKKLRLEWSTLWPLKPRREQTRMFHAFFRERHKGEKQSPRRSGFRPCTHVGTCRGDVNSVSQLYIPPSSDCVVETMDDTERFISEEVTDAGLRLRQPRVRSYERKGLSFVEVDLPGISAADITLSLQDDRLTLYALNNLGRIAYEWETYILPTIPARNFQCGIKQYILGISWPNWGSGEDTSPQQIQSLEISNEWPWQ